MGREDTPKRLTAQSIADLATAIRYMHEELTKVHQQMIAEGVDAIAARQWIKGEEGLSKLSGYVQMLSNSLRIRLVNRSSMTIEEEIDALAKPKRPDRPSPSEKADSTNAKAAKKATKKPKPKGS